MSKKYIELASLWVAGWLFEEMPKDMISKFKTGFGDFENWQDLLTSIEANLEVIEAMPFGPRDFKDARSILTESGNAKNFKKIAFIGAASAVWILLQKKDQPRSTYIEFLIIVNGVVKRSQLRSISTSELKNLSWAKANHRTFFKYGRHTGMEDEQIHDLLKHCMLEEVSA